MSVKYNVVERGNPSNPMAPKKFYPSIHFSGRLTLRELAEIAADRSTLTTSDFIAAVETFLAIIPKELTKGNIVELGDFGSFWLKTTTEGAETAEEVRAEQISTVLPRFIPGKQFKRTLNNIEFNKN
jgi:predicted histone-like DNA-binding protein